MLVIMAVDRIAPPPVWILFSLSPPPDGTPLAVTAEDKAAKDGAAADKAAPGAAAASLDIRPPARARVSPGRRNPCAAPERSTPATVAIELTRPIIPPLPRSGATCARLPRTASARQPSRSGGPARGDERGRVDLLPVSARSSSCPAAGRGRITGAPLHMPPASTRRTWIRKTSERSHCPFGQRPSVAVTTIAAGQGPSPAPAARSADAGRRSGSKGMARSVERVGRSWFRPVDGTSPTVRTTPPDRRRGGGPGGR